MDIITLMKTILPASKTQSLLFWLVGHLGVVDDGHLLFILPLWVVGLACLWSIKGQLEILSFGMEESKLLGIDCDRIVKITIVANCILIGNVVSFAGMIGFVGLVIPHLVRLMIVADLRYMLPLSMVMGAICLVVFDSLSRMSFLLLGSQVPVGALSALFLSPLFFFVLLKGYHDS